jgi:hypothetical protein
MSGVIDHANLTLKLDVLQLNAADLGTGGYATLPIFLDWSAGLANGTGAAQASQVYQDTGTLAGSASTNIDLAGSLTNIFGTTITFTKIKLIALQADSANNVANNLQLSRGSSNGFVWFLAASDGFYLAPGASFVWYDPVGVTVTAATGDILTLTNGAGTNTITYRILIIGTD